MIMIMIMLLTAVFGLIIGSFLTVVIKRYPLTLQRAWQADCRVFLGLEAEKAPLDSEKISLVKPRSHCVYCKTKIPFYHMIPLLSFLILRGRCHHCHRAIARLYPWVETVSAVLSMAVVYRYGLTGTAMVSLVLSYMLIVLTCIDLEHQLLPDVMTMGGLWVGLLCNSYHLFTNLSDAVWASAIGYLSFWLLAWIFLQWRKKNGMGHGDFKMIAMIGAWFGGLGMCNTLIVAVFSSVIVSMGFIFFKRSAWNDPIPFGPFLALGACITLLSPYTIFNVLVL